MAETSQDFYRIQKLPPYVFAVINEMRAKARAAQIDIIDLGMGNPDGATPRVVVSKLVEAARNARNHRYSQSRGIPKLREEITKRYLTNYGVELDPEREAIVTIGAKDALAHLLFATVGPGDVVVSPNPGDASGGRRARRGRRRRRGARFARAARRPAAKPRQPEPLRRYPGARLPDLASELRLPRRLRRQDPRAATRAGHGLDGVARWQDLDVHDPPRREVAGGVGRAA